MNNPTASGRGIKKCNKYFTGMGNGYTIKTLRRNVYSINPTEKASRNCPA
jgi:hypothetical protein